MEKVKVLGVPFELTGTTITKDAKLAFKAIDNEEQDFDSQKLKGLKVVSFFPALNTSVCDNQTTWIAENAPKYPDVHFISISVDKPEVQKAWCIAHKFPNALIVSDYKYHDFANQTNFYIKNLEHLIRGLIIIDQNDKIIALKVTNDIVDTPDFKWLELELAKITKK